VLRLTTCCSLTRPLQLTNADFTPLPSCPSSDSRVPGDSFNSPSAHQRHGRPPFPDCSAQSCHRRRRSPGGLPSTSQLVTSSWAKSWWTTLPTSSQPRRQSPFARQLSTASTRMAPSARRVARAALRLPHSGRAAAKGNPTTTFDPPATVAAAASLPSSPDSCFPFPLASSSRLLSCLFLFLSMGASSPHRCT